MTSKLRYAPLALLPCITFGLGVWQVQRLQWKETLIADIKRLRQLEPIALTEDAGSIPVIMSNTCM
jgi:cytochrome oxidase assembly protein ShyY1